MEELNKRNTFSQEEINNVNLPAEKRDNIIKKAYIWIIDRLKKVLSKQNENIEKKDNSSELTVDELDKITAGMPYKHIEENKKKNDSSELTVDELDKITAGRPRWNDDEER